MKNKLLIICDVEGWAYDRFAKGFQAHSNQWDISIAYGNKTKEGYLECFEQIKGHDLCLFMVDSNPQYVANYGGTSGKVLQAIRSNLYKERKEVIRKYKYYSSNFLKNCKGIVTANSSIYNDWKDKHEHVFLMEGGVDTSIFKYKEKMILGKTRVGWAGSIKNFGYSFRGLEIIEEACDQVGVVWNPAYREHKWRDVEEMVNYYHNEIDIYVDMSFSAGRQNGLLEAASCGCSVIANDVGVTNSLIVSGKNGVISERNVNSLKRALFEAVENYLKYTSDMQKTIQEIWSWEKQALKFEKFLNTLLEKEK